MEVGRVGGNFENSGWQHCAPPAGRRSAVSIAEQKTFLRKEKLKANVPPVGRQSAVRMARPKKDLTGAGLLMEVARKPFPIPISV